MQVVREGKVTDFPGETPEQHMDIWSKRYVDAARVVPTKAEDGTPRWGVFSMARGDLVGVVDDSQLVEAIREAVQRSQGYFMKAQADLEAKKLAAAPAPAEQKATVSLEDLGF